MTILPNSSADIITTVPRNAPANDEGKETNYISSDIYYNNLEVEKGATVSGSLVRETPTSNVSSISQSEKSVLDGASKSIPSKK